MRYTTANSHPYYYTCMYVMIKVIFYTINSMLIAKSQQCYMLVSGNLFYQSEEIYQRNDNLEKIQRCLYLMTGIFGHCPRGGNVAVCLYPGNTSTGMTNEAFTSCNSALNNKSV